MPYNKEELFKLPVEEKLQLIEELWDKIDDQLMPVSEEEIKFAKERLKLHKKKLRKAWVGQNFKKKIKEKYGF
jgi:putative addiction module component (TIGR02574 family)